MTEIKKDTIATGHIINNLIIIGLFNMVGNKGGIGIALRIRNRNFMFINSHLKSG